jgi:prepilin-type N-terminal cleavage/methylation domain-containing protein
MAAIGIIAAGVTLVCLWIGGNTLIDKYQGRKRRQMATPMEVDEIMLRRLKKSVAVRIEQRKMANKGFTIIELLIVLAIIGSLSWLALTSIDKAIKAKHQFMADCKYPTEECEQQWKNRTK